MKRIRRLLLGVLFAIAMATFLLPVECSGFYCDVTKIYAATGDVVESGDWEYKMLGDGTIEITKYIGQDTEVVVPSQIDGYSVKGIGDSAFEALYSVKSVEIPRGITSIGACAFYGCFRISNIDIPEGVTSIGGAAFYGCTSLSSIDIPEGITSIGNNTFYECSSISSIDIPEGVTSIGDSAFRGCTSLRSIDIPEGITSIGDIAFYGCTSLRSIDIPEGVTSIGSHTFCRCESLSSIDIPEGVRSIGDSAFYGCESLSSINIPEGVTSIGDIAFYGCTSLRSIDIPEGITSIGDYAFRGCESLRSIDIPEGITSIGDYAFYGCTSLSYVVLPESIISIGNNVFSNLTIISKENSYAYNYAINNSDDRIKWIAINSIERPDVSVLMDCSDVVYDGIEKVPLVVVKLDEQNLVEGKDYIVTYINNIDVGTATVIVEGKGNYIGKVEKTFVINPSSVKSLTYSTRSSSAVALKWNANQYVTGYIIEQYTDGEWIVIKDITDVATVSCKVTGLSASTTYKFRIKAYSAIGDNRYYSEYTGMSVNTLPSGVKNFTYSARSSSAVALKWAKNTSANGYVIEQYKSGKWVAIKTITSNATVSYKVTGLSASTTCKFRIRAYKTYGTSKLYSGYVSKTVNTLPSGVKSFTYSARSSSAVVLKWTKNTSASGYVIEQYKNGKWVVIKTITKNSTVSYKVTGLKASTANKFRIKAYKSYGSSKLYSGYVSKSVNTLPSGVTGFTYSDRSNNTITLKWNKNGSASGYVIEQYKNGKWVVIKTVTKNSIVSYKVSGLKKATSYKFRIKAYKSYGSTKLYSGYVTKTIKTK